MMHLPEFSAELISTLYKADLNSPIIHDSYVS